MTHSEEVVLELLELAEKHIPATAPERARLMYFRGYFDGAKSRPKERAKRRAKSRPKNGASRPPQPGG